MAKINVRYLVQKAGAHRPRHFWQPSQALRAAGWQPRRLADNLAQAIDEAEAINAELDQWRAGHDGTAATVETGSVAAAIRAYLRSPEFHRTAPRTQKSYRAELDRIEAWAGDVPVRAITAKRVKTFYGALARPDGEGRPTTLASANATLRVLRLLYSYAMSEDLADANPARAVKLIGTPPRVEIWLPSQIALMVEWADAMDLFSIGDAVLLAKYSGQRQGDVLRMRGRQRQDRRIRVKQGKTGTWVDVPETPKLTDRLDAARARLNRFDNACPELIIAEATGRAYKGDHFRHSFATVRAAAAREDPAIAGLKFLDLRDTAVTALAEAGCTVPEICAITGHAEPSAHAILKHYLAVNSAMASAAIAKLVAYEAQKNAGRTT